MKWQLSKILIFPHFSASSGSEQCSGPFRWNHLFVRTPGPSGGSCQREQGDVSVPHWERSPSDTRGTRWAPDPSVVVLLFQVSTLLYFSSLFSSHISSPISYCLVSCFESDWASVELRLNSKETGQMVANTEVKFYNCSTHQTWVSSLLLPLPPPSPQPQICSIEAGAQLNLGQWCIDARTLRRRSGS